MSPKSHFTTRRGFIAAMGFGGVSLYGLWAAYGAAPGPLALLGLDGAHDAHGPGTGGGHGGHGAGAHGPTPEEFNRITAEFVERYRLPDGTVHPRVLALSQPNGKGHMDHGDAGAMHPGAAGHDTMDHGGMNPVSMDHGSMDHDSMDHGSMDHDTPGHGAPTHGTAEHGTAGDHAGAHADQGELDDHAHDDGALDVYLAAGMWYYQPGKLRLDAGQPYHFKMMAVDVSHGASIQFGRGGRIVRLRPGRVTEMDITFHKPGRYLVYCTVYCGPAHDVMQATIEVV
jgi:cytochrome c oxidase subunit II